MLSFSLTTLSLFLSTSCLQDGCLRTFRRKSQILFIYLFFFYKVISFKKVIYLFGCVGSWLRYVGSFVAAHLLSRCSLQAWECVGSVTVAIGLVSLQHDTVSSMFHLSSPTRNWTCVPCIARQILNHWTTREVLVTVKFVMSLGYLR